MEEVISADIIKATQASLGKYVKRPPLTDKLLKKPPFRFLHDIITSVLKTTGFFNGLFEESELISDNVKDKESKILFLTKVISVIGTTTGKSLGAKPSKIVAGQEVEKTNELLQCLAFALDNNLSSNQAVKLFKESEIVKTSKEKKGKDATKHDKRDADSKKLTSRSSEKLVKIDKNPKKSKVKENTTSKKELPSKKLSQSSKTLNKNVYEKEKQNNDNENKNNSIYVNKVDNPVVKAKESRQNSEERNPNNAISKLEVTHEDENSTCLISSTNNIQNVAEHSNNLAEENANVMIEDIANEPLEKHNEIESDMKEQKLKEHEIITSEFNRNNSLETSSVNFNDSNTQKQDKIISGFIQPEHNATDTTVNASSSKRPTSVRPSSSRPGAPRFRDKNELLLCNAVDNLVIGKVNIIAEHVAHEEEEESSIVIVDNTDTNLQNEIDHLPASPSHHGHLVQQILKAQQEFTEGNGKTNIEWKTGAHKTRDVVNQEVELLRFNVQALSRIANPLVKLLDHIQEDVEVMRQELQQWTKSYEETSKQLLKQKAANEESLLPLRSKVKQLEGEIPDKCDKINDLKIIIHKNALRIEKLLASGNVQ